MFVCFICWQRSFWRLKWIASAQKKILLYCNNNLYPLQLTNNKLSAELNSLLSDGTEEVQRIDEEIRFFVLVGYRTVVYCDSTLDVAREGSWLGRDLRDKKIHFVVWVPDARLVTLFTGCEEDDRRSLRIETL